MTAFADSLRRSVLAIEHLEAGVFANVVSAVHESVVEGSLVTGAPGQPVGQYGPGYHPGKVGGTLKNSWQTTFVAPDVAEVSTNIVYAPSIEDGLSYAHGGTPMRLRSTVGGFHSVLLTRLGFGRLVRAAAEASRP
jgi:hypothetical protein